MRAAVHRYPTLLAFYVGTGDTRFRPENVRLDRELTQARIAHVFRLYAAGHSPELWQLEAAAWLSLAVRHLEPATKG